MSKNDEDPINDEDPMKKILARRQFIEDNATYANIDA